MSISSVTVGIDVAKAHLDICVLGAEFTAVSYTHLTLPTKA